MADDYRVQVEQASRDVSTTLTIRQLCIWGVHPICKILLGLMIVICP